MTEQSPTPVDPWPHSQATMAQTPAAFGPPEDPTRRTLRWLVPVAGGTAVLAVAVFLLVLLWPFGNPGQRAAPLGFQPLETVVQAQFSDSSNTVFSAVIGDRAYAAAVRDGDLELIALDLDTGEEAWRERVAGTERWSRLTALPDSVVVFGDHFNNSEPRPMLVLDAEDGHVRWERDIYGNDGTWFFDDTMLLADRAEGRLRGLDLATGEPLWSEVLPQRSSIVGVLDDDDLNRPSSLRGGVPHPLVSRHVVITAEDRSVQVIDAAGGIVSEGTNVADPGDLLLAYGDWLYVATDEAGYRVDAYQLADVQAEPRALYRVRDAERAPATMRPCGDGQVCLLDRVGGDDDTTELLGLAVDGGEPWREPAAGAEWLVAAGEWTVVGGGSPGLRAFDAGGEMALETSGTPVRLNAGNLLVFASTPDSFPDDLSVAGRPVGQAHTELGLVSEVVGDSCSWTEHYLACPGRGGAAVWRFTGD